MSELERLREQLAMLRMYGMDHETISAACLTVSEEIARLEAEAADPWREARNVLGHWAATGAMTHITGLFDHLTAENERLQHNAEQLTAENARLEKRVAELEKERNSAGKKCNELYEAKRNAELQRDKALKRAAELEAEDTADVADAEAALAKGEFVPFEDMQPPFEGPIVGIEPVLDPARVLATAAVRLDEMHISGGAYLRNYTDGARPYRMCERGVSIAFVDDLEVEPKRAIATTKNIVEAAGWLKTANDLKRFLAEMGGSGSIPYRTKGETNELA